MKIAWKTSNPPNKSHTAWRAAWWIVACDALYTQTIQYLPIKKESAFGQNQVTATINTTSIATSDRHSATGKMLTLIKAKQTVFLVHAIYEIYSVSQHGIQNHRSHNNFKSQPTQNPWFKPHSKHQYYNHMPNQPFVKHTSSNISHCLLSFVLLTCARWSKGSQITSIIPKQPQALPESLPKRPKQLNIAKTKTKTNEIRQTTDHLP